ncbi:AI-2E family transporter [Microvirga sp. ACRRW]|uniref:AI-2E family transporter n=1 Tax=Microvirga sp. ACRRW TaxID=2918205 RepID=UPI001EF49C64|nr:AI-2E family transporter [Microvirga sp. ACRRW]MCG7394726.1 AI-2E family transporter [Microvirga sp. ACRRW]
MLLGAVYIAEAVIAPVAFSLFLIAILWPLQSRLQAHIPRLVALAISIFLLVVTFSGFASLIVWAFSRVGRWILINLSRFQALYNQMILWLEEQGIAVAGLWAEHFNIGWIVSLMQKLTGQVNTTLSFWLVVLVYVIIGLLEVEGTSRKINMLPNHRIARVILGGSEETAVKIRRYMIVRTLMSVLTGILVWAFALLFGLPLAQEWGVIAFTLNYIPFIGPFIATLFPTLLAMVQFDTWQAVIVVFACLNLIQFVVGSYIEPRLSGTVLAMSPFVVLFAIFLWTFLWGLPGTFIGIPITIAVLSFCAQDPSTRWLAIQLGPPDETDPPIPEQTRPEA